MCGATTSVALISIGGSNNISLVFRCAHPTKPTKGVTSVNMKCSANSIKYGYIFWSKSQDEAAKQLFGGMSRIKVVFEGNVVGEKNIDWKYRRISIGKKAIQSLPSATSSYYIATVNQSGELHLSGSMVMTV